MADYQPGDLRPVDGGPAVEVVEPTHCGRGHRLGPGQTTVSYARCGCGKGRGGGHNTWRCSRCGDVVYGDGHTDHSQLYGSR